MKADKTANDSNDVSKVFQKLICDRYLDNAETYICPASDDFHIEMSDEVRNNPKQFQWGSPDPSGNNQPPNAASADPNVFANSQLSYTYLRRRVNPDHIRSDTMISADKALRQDYAGPPSNENAPIGNHLDGFNVLYADGHVEFVNTSENELCQQLTYELHMGTFDPKQFGGK